MNEVGLLAFQLGEFVDFLKTITLCFGIILGVYSLRGLWCRCKTKK